jgi:hypothetical protein
MKQLNRRSFRVWVAAISPLMVLAVTTVATPTPASAKSAKPTKLRRQMNARVDYTATLDIAAKDAITGESVRVTGQTTFAATKNVLVDTYVGPKNKRVYQLVNGKGLRTDRTRGSVSGTYNEQTNGSDLASTATYTFDSDNVKFDFDISRPGTWGTGRDISLTMTADKVVGPRQYTITSDGVTSNLTETGYLFAPLLMVKPDFTQANTFDVTVESFPSAGSVTIFDPPPAAAPDPNTLGASLFDLINTKPELVWFGAVNDDRPGTFLKTRFEQTRVRQMQSDGKPSDGTLTERLVFTVDVVNPTFRPYKG